MTPSTTAATVVTGSRLGAALDRKLADAGQPLFDAVGWYRKACLATRDFNYSDLSANEKCGVVARYRVRFRGRV
jgi:hypothetical protein